MPTQMAKEEQNCTSKLVVQMAEYVLGVEVGERDQRF
jgi:hypothetical protein